MSLASNVAGGGAVDAAHAVGLGIAALVGLVLLLRAARIGALYALGLTLLAVVVLGPVVQPWYLIWALAGFGRRGGPTNAVAPRGVASAVLCLLILPGGRHVIRPPLYGVPALLAIAAGRTFLAARTRRGKVGQSGRRVCGEASRTAGTPTHARPDRSRRRWPARRPRGNGLAQAAPVKTAASGCPAPPQLTFDTPSYVDKTRAGGEPLVATYPNGRLLYSAHAGTTHFFTPEAPNAGTAAFGENYTGQTYIWTSDDNGKTWTFRPRIIAPQGAPASGFSDPEFAIDSAGGLFFSEINLANVAVSSSREDHGTTWNLENFTGAVLTDRQWMEADRKGELYFVANGQPGGTGIPPGAVSGHYISKSTDGGKTFTASIADQTGGDGPRRHPRRQAQRHRLRGALRRQQAQPRRRSARRAAVTSRRPTPT